MTDRPPQPHRSALLAAVTLAGAALACFVWAMGWVSSIWPAPAGDSAVTPGHLWPYWLGLAAAWGALSAVAVMLWRRRSPEVNAGGGAFGHAALIILLVALVARVLVTATTSPVLSDDLWRYVLDGETLAGGDNPYRLSPAERAAETPPTRFDHPAQHARFIELIDRVNHPHLVTIYQPLSQWSFALMYRARSLASNPFRLGFVLVDMAIVALLLGALRAAGASPWWAVLYAWHPLAVSETAGSGHQDVLGILPLLGALLLTQRLRGAAKPSYVHTNVRGSAAGGLLAMAVAVKPVVAPLALPLAWRIARGRPRRRAVMGVGAAAAAGCVVLAALYLPFAWMPGGLGRMLETARAFVGDWAFNGSIHALLSAWFSHGAVADWGCAGLLVSVLVATVALRLDAIEAAISYLLAALLLSSTAHPWYLLWALALVPLRPRFALTPAVWVWSLTISWSYAAHLTPGYHVPAWVAAAEYGPVYAAAAAGVWMTWRSAQTRGARLRA